MIDKVTILYDHYKFTCDMVRQKEKSRNKIFIFCTALIAILLITTFEPNTKNLVTQYFQYLVHSDTPLDIPTIDSFIYMVFAYSILVFYNSCIIIERQYKYIHKLEVDMQKQLEYDFSRDVNQFEQKSSMIPRIIYILNTLLFPLIGAILVLYKSITDIQARNENAILNLFVGFVGLLIIAAYMTKKETRISLAAVINENSI